VEQSESSKLLFEVGTKFKKEFPREYGGLERLLAEQDFARFKGLAASMLASRSNQDTERKGSSGI
jgi:hypothetical protein